MVVAEKKLILLGITGGIAAYKSCELVRLLQNAGFNVRVVMTKHATEFVGPATFRALTGHQVALDLFEDPQNPIHHISLSKEPDCFVIAPATANVIAKIAQGVADDLLTTTALAFQGPLIIAPAMNEAMLTDPATRENIEILTSYGARIVETDAGYLACGDAGSGRLADIESIARAVQEEMSRADDLRDKRILITAGPTREAIDAVRFISNYSSGRMGYALAQEALLRGANVTLISGPTALRAPVGASVVYVESTREMQEALDELAGGVDVVICSAAVSDYRPSTQHDRKLKRGSADDASNLESIELTENPDLLRSLADRRQRGELPNNPMLIGFAAETDDLIENARKKLLSKGVDYIVANDVSRTDIGFDAPTNEVYLISADSEVKIEFAPKRTIARHIFDRLA